MPQLSAELFSQIVMGLQSDERASARHGKRKEGRVGVSCSIQVTPPLCDDNGPKTTRVKVRDISQSGIGFIAHMRMDVGLELECTLPRSDGTTVEIKLVVRHCVQVSKGLFGIGASFDRTKILPPVKPKETAVPPPKEAVAAA